MDDEKRLRDITWDDYGISKQRYKELKAFCRQYGEKKDKIKYGLSAVVQDGMPHGNTVGSPTERQAIINAQYTRDVAMIEECAIRANPSIWRSILRSVTEGKPYEAVLVDPDYGTIPYGKTDFYGYRRLFFYYLHCEKLGTN